jgi:hypothetical protein
MGDLVPRKELVKQGMKGIGGIVCGGVLLVLSGLSGPVGWIVGGLLTIVGIGISSSKEDRTAGAITAAAGILTLISTLIPGIGGAAGWLMRIGGIGLLIAGGYSLIQFIINIKKRS